LAGLAAQLGVDVASRQTNHEGQLIEWVHDVPGKFDAVLINPGAYTHTSIALRDAIAAAGVPAVEVHLSNPSAREGFRHVSHLEGVSRASVAGFGKESYLLALRGIVTLLAERG